MSPPGWPPLESSKTGPETLVSILGAEECPWRPKQDVTLPGRTAWRHVELKERLEEPLQQGLLGEGLGVWGAQDGLGLIFVGSQLKGRSNMDGIKKLQSDLKLVMIGLGSVRPPSLSPTFVVSSLEIGHMVLWLFKVPTHPPALSGAPGRKRARVGQAGVTASAAVARETTRCKIRCL